ncbi:MAG: multi-sensor hybrid histidine kinase [Burkholderia sp.]|nr:multi-sensor hybrid histidine kinase [Burkholderia sp.]
MLRCLGSHATLVLLNGCRITATPFHDASPGQSTLYNLNAIPVAAIERIEMAKSTFLANMSHEPRSPLDAMLGFTRLLRRDGRLPEYTREDLGIVVRSGEHLYTLIIQVLDLSKIEAVRATLEVRNFDLYELLDVLAEMFTLAARQKGLQLSVVREPDVPKFIRAVAVKLNQVLINLLNNAIKFTNNGSVPPARYSGRH